ncbi:hypothetical protein GCM10020255_038740 [Rhodococcus baikonurensis]
MEPDEALREIAYWLERSRAETHRVKAYRRAAEVFAGLSDEQKESRRKSDSWKALTGIGPKTAMIIAQSYDGVPEYLEELRGRLSPSATAHCDKPCAATSTHTPTGPTVAAPSKR